MSKNIFDKIKFLNSNQKNEVVENSSDLSQDYLRTQQILKKINSHILIRKIISALCYIMIFGGSFVYIGHFFQKTRTIKIINNLKENSKSLSSEKVMINPRLKLEYEENEIYNIKAKKAFHKDNQEVLMQDVFAEGKIGQISAGELKIEEDGNHLTFTKNPVIILNKTE